MSEKTQPVDGRAKATLDYYDRNAGKFTSDTVDLNFNEIPDRFLRFLEPGARILDFGCGSGRDSRYFLSRGYEVEACDGSPQMVRIASGTAGIRVKQMLFEELDEVERYDGIFACSSILHVPYAELPGILARMKRAVKKGGVIYVSFKYGSFEGERNGRYFTDVNEDRLRDLIEAEARLDADGGHGNAQADPLRIAEMRITRDVRPGRESEKWLNAILIREAGGERSGS